MTKNKHGKEAENRTTFQLGDKIYIRPRGPESTEYEVRFVEGRIVGVSYRLRNGEYASTMYVDCTMLQRA